MKNNKIVYGKKDLLPAKIDPKDVSVRISIVMESDLLQAIKESAAEEGAAYQTLLKQKLREMFLPDEHLDAPPKTEWKRFVSEFEKFREKFERVEHVEKQKKRA